MRTARLGYPAVSLLTGETMKSTRTATLSRPEMLEFYWFGVGTVLRRLADANIPDKAA
jgi:hypothetical protein